MRDPGAEHIAIDSYCEMIGYLGNDDLTTRQMLEGILVKEDRYDGDLANLLEELGA